MWTICYSDHFYINILVITLEIKGEVTFQVWAGMSSSWSYVSADLVSKYQNDNLNNLYID